MAKLIFGCGYLGERVARLWRKQRQMVMAVTRDERHSLELAMAELFTIGADVTKPQTLGCLKPLSEASEKNSIDTVLFAVGYDSSADQTIDEVYAGGLQNVLAALPSTVRRVIYISTTGVYGNGRDGEWVDEDTPRDPQRDGGKASLAAERILAASPFADRGIALRLAGIYGPGRIPFLDKLRAGESIPAASEGYLNLIHVDDAAAVVVAAADQNRQHSTYCVSDGNPVQRGDYYREVARLLGAPPPTFMKPDLNSPRAARAEANRRVKNSRMLADFQVKLQYPDYRAGLAAILAGG